MSKSEYTNTFSLAINAEAQDAVLVFFNVAPAINEEQEIIGKKAEEISTLVMTTQTLIELRNVIDRALSNPNLQNNPAIK